MAALSRRSPTPLLYHSGASFANCVYDPIVMTPTASTATLSSIPECLTFLVFLLYNNLFESLIPQSVCEAEEPTLMTQLQATASQEIRAEIERRRTFAIISHPDAGKTTLTEKLLLYGGAIRQAGSVKARKAERHAKRLDGD